MVRASNRTEIDGRRCDSLMLMRTTMSTDSQRPQRTALSAGYTSQGVLDPEFMLPRMLPRGGQTPKLLFYHALWTAAYWRQ